jgi:hypothetical protein
MNNFIHLGVTIDDDDVNNNGKLNGNSSKSAVNKPSQQQQQQQQQQHDNNIIGEDEQELPEDRFHQKDATSSYLISQREQAKKDKWDKHEK